MANQLNPQQKKDLKALDQLSRMFFDLFTNTNKRIPQVKEIYTLFIPQGLLINNSRETPQFYNLDNFIAPREEMLTNGTLTDFREWETDQKTELNGNIAQRISNYEKSGNMNGEVYRGKGTKMFQFIKTDNIWRIVSVIWEDEK